MSEPESPPALRLLIEIGPLATFWIVNRAAGIYWATGVFMVAILTSLIASRIIEHRWPVMPLVTAGVVLVFGGLTLLLKDEQFIKLKPTVVNVLFATILFASYAFDKGLLEYLLGSAFELTERGWRALTLRWALFFLFLAGVNEIVWRNTSTDTWVNFKTFGILPMTLAFMMSQVGLMKREALAPPEETD